MERPLTSGQILPRSFCPKKDWNGGDAKLIVTKYSAPQKAIIGGCGIKAEKEHQYPMLTVEKWERQISSRNCLPKRVMNNAFAGVTNCFHSFNMFVTSSTEKFKDLYYST